MKKSFIALGAALLCSVSGAAMAQQLVGPYVGVSGGASFLEDANEHGGSIGGLTTSYDTGYGALLSLGYEFGNGFRAELEGGYRENDAKSRTGISSNGNTHAYTGLVNGLYDFDTGTPFTPYIGAGIGAASIRTEHTVNNPGFVSQNGHDTTFAYQGIAGVDYAVTPELKLGINYHYLGTNDVNVRLQGSGDARYSYHDHAVFLQLKYSFGEPPAPPAPAPVAAPAAAPAPAPETQRAFQVFFDFNKSNITAAAAKVIRQAAASVRQGNLTRITVTGHTDTVGSARYNQGLSERRADSVKRQLIADGVAGNEITTVGVGKTGLLVPTGDGVREPQNRRAEIVLQ